MNKTLVLPHFPSKCKSYFITIKPPMGAPDKYQKVNFWSDRLRKLSSTYFIVREKNKAFDGYHFHALAVLATLPPKTWYKKGYHYCVRKTGKSETFGTYLYQNENHLSITDVQEIMARQLDNSPHPDAELSDQILTGINLVEQDLEKQHKNVYLMGKIIDYCCKEGPLIQYYDYCLVSRGKQV